MLGVKPGFVVTIPISILLRSAVSDVFKIFIANNCFERFFYILICYHINVSHVCSSQPVGSKVGRSFDLIFVSKYFLNCQRAVAYILICTILLNNLSYVQI